MAHLKSNLLKGFLWTGIDALINRGFYIVIQLFLAKLLFPEDYGIVAMAAVFIALLEIVNDLGLGSALIQKETKNLTKLHYDTAFWTGLVWSFLLYTIIYFIGTPAIAAFYDEVLLITVLPCMALSILLSPLVSIHRAKLIKSLQFKKIAVVNTISTVSSGLISLYLAYNGFGVWALVFYSVVKLVVAVPLLFTATKWVPSLHWNLEAFRLLFGFGVFTLGTAITNVFSQKIDFLLIGKLIGAAALGYYTLAFLITNVLRQQISSVLSKVLFPVYSQLQDEPQKLFSLYLKILSVNALIVYPILLGIFLFSEEILPQFFQDKWNESIKLIKILCISGVIQMVVNGNQLLFRSYGKVKLEFLLQLVKSFLFFIPLIYIGILKYEATGAALGYTLAAFCSALLTLFFLGKTFGLRVNHLIEAFKIPVGMLVVCSVFTWFILQNMSWNIALIFYGMSVLIFYTIFAKKQTRFLISIIKNRFN